MVLLGRLERLQVVVAADPQQLWNWLKKSAETYKIYNRLEAHD
jgi:hypothetical protein